MVGVVLSAASPPSDPHPHKPPMDPFLGSLSSRYSEWIVDALSELPHPFLLTDPSLPGHPIVFASPSMLRSSGYDAGDLLGRNARIFQGPSTDRRSVAEIREAIRQEKPMELTLLNYTKGGVERWILFSMFPVFEGCEGGGVAHFVSVHVPISGMGERRRRSLDGCAPIVMGTCREELRGERCAGAVATADSFFDSDNRVLQAEQLCQAGDLEKEQAISAANNILSTLARYSELTGRRVSGKRNNVASVAPLNSSLIISLGRIKQSFVLTDPRLPDMPVVYASVAFLELTGYNKDEILSRNCRFLYGSATDSGTLNQIGQCIQASRSCSVRILSYRKNGSPFWNLLHVSPVRNATGKVAFHVWVYADDCDKKSGQELSPEMRQLGAVGAVKVAVRSTSSGADP